MTLTTRRHYRVRCMYTRNTRRTDGRVSRRPSDGPVTRPIKNFHAPGAQPPRVVNRCRRRRRVHRARTRQTTCRRCRTGAARRRDLVVAAADREISRPQCAIIIVFCTHTRRGDATFARASVDENAETIGVVHAAAYAPRSSVFRRGGLLAITVA